MDTHPHPLHSDREGQESVRAPDWTNWNEHDPGVMIVALFGFLAVGLLWQSSGPPHGTGSRLYRMLGVGLGVAGAALLLRQRRRKRPCAQESGS